MDSLVSAFLCFYIAINIAYFVGLFMNFLLGNTIKKVFKNFYFETLTFVGRVFFGLTCLPSTILFLFVILILKVILNDDLFVKECNKEVLDDFRREQLFLRIDNVLSSENLSLEDKAKFLKYSMKLTLEEIERRKK